jgi:glyoxylate reductase
MTGARERPAVLVTRRIPCAVVRRLGAACDVDVYSGEAAIPRDELLLRVRGKAALMCLLTDRVDGDVMDAAGALRVIANIAVGFDNVDLAAAAARGIVVTHTPDVLTDASAELTWALILSVTRRVPEGERLLRRGAWKGWALDFLLGAELKDKQLGIVGMGRIGQAVAAKAPAFGMRVAYTSKGAVHPASYRGLGTLPAGERMSLDQLLATSHVVSLHVPMTPATHHLIDQRALLRMRRSAYLVNTSRGAVVDEAALAWALREHVISGAALDVYEREPAVHPDLLDLENVVLAPHLGSGTTETRSAMADLAARNVLAVLEGRAPLTPVSLPA